MILNRLYAIWVIFSLAFFFLLFIIPLLLCAPFQRLHGIALRINHLWAWGFFRLAFIPVALEWRTTFDRKRQYILCANHFSYIDIPALGLLPVYFKFVGKSQLANIPLFGLMYNKIHITVNRASYKSRAETMNKGREESKAGFSLGFFPEGGIKLRRFPVMVPFKDGAFRIACEQQLPILPVTLPDNYAILKDDEIFSIKRKKLKIIIHPPEFPQGNGEEDVQELKERVSKIIQNELNEMNKSTKNE